ncbi:MAG: hypothetical protein ACLPVF_14345 [Acidimicrobiales bacterium]
MAAIDGSGEDGGSPGPPPEKAPPDSITEFVSGLGTNVLASFVTLFVAAELGLLHVANHDGLWISGALVVVLLLVFFFVSPDLFRHGVGLVQNLVAALLVIGVIAGTRHIVKHNGQAVSNGVLAAMGLMIAASFIYALLMQPTVDTLLSQPAEGSRKNLALSLFACLVFGTGWVLWSEMNHDHYRDMNRVWALVVCFALGALIASPQFDTVRELQNKPWYKSIDRWLERMTKRPV